MRIMAIDYGDAHTGIAVSDPTGLLAGFTTKKGDPSDAGRQTASPGGSRTGCQF